MFKRTILSAENCKILIGKCRISGEIIKFLHNMDEKINNFMY